MTIGSVSQQQVELKRVNGACGTRLRARGMRCCKRSCCREPCCSVTSMGLLVLTAIWVSVQALDNGVLWTRRGATTQAPPVIIASVVCAAVLGDLLNVIVMSQFPQCRPEQQQQGSMAPTSRQRAVWCMGRVRRVAAGIAMGLLLFLLSVYLSRTQSARHLDDVSPLIPCDYLNTFRKHPSAKFLHVIPMHSGVPMSANRTWCDSIKRLEQEGFVLSMHGVHHQMRWSNGVDVREFEGLSLAEARARMAVGVAVWQDAFGSPPRHFSFPGQWGSKAIVDMLKSEFNFTHVRSLADGALQRVFHCDDSFCQTFCKAWFTDLV